ncbi:MAG: 6-phosphogluconolactonase [Thermoflexales bacterium]|nr:6-phosphogluconolactonase [Thermoflexales bacterium]
MDKPFVVFLNEAQTYTLHVAPTQEALLPLAASAVVFCARKAIERRGVFHWALSGGNTPRALYALLAAPPYAEQIDWSRTHLWWSDERTVPPDHPDSNFGMARQAMIEKVTIPPANVHRVPTELEPDVAAACYETDLRQALDLGEHGRARFDLILLGMGEDGHTASLFPETPALDVQDMLVAANPVPKLHTTRITFTYPLINAADTVIFLVTGATKALALRQVLLGDWRPKHLPAQAVLPATGKLMWMCDAAAAAQVTPTPGYPQTEVIYRRLPSL